MTSGSKGRFGLRRALVALLLVCGATPALAADLTVSAAASLTNAFRELAPLFEAKYPGTKVLLNFGASEALLQQIAKGAPADVFASADQETVDRAQQRNMLVAGSRHDFVSNSLVLIVPSDSRLNVRNLADLTSPEVRRVAIGNPAGVPAGRYAKGALEAAKLWPQVEAKSVNATSVRQALDYVARGEVDAGFVYATDAALFKDRVRTVATIPTEVPVRYPVAVVAGGPNPEAAARFVDYLRSDAGAQAVLAKFGFGRP